MTDLRPKRDYRDVGSGTQVTGKDLLVCLCAQKFSNNDTLLLA